MPAGKIYPFPYDVCLRHRQTYPQQTEKDEDMTKKARRQFAMNTLYSVSAIGFGLAVYEGRAGAFLMACVAYVSGYLIARRADMEANGD